MIYLILLILMVFITIFRIHLRNQRVKLVCEMDALYDKMILYIAKNQIKPDAKLLKWLRGHKNIIVNYELADIQICLLHLFSAKPDTLEQRNSECKAYEESLPPDLKELSNQISVRVLKLVRLSQWKPDFVWFVIKGIALESCRRGMSGIKQFMAGLRTCISNSNNIYMLDNKELLVCR